MAYETGVCRFDYIKGATSGYFDNDGCPDIYLSTIRGPQSPAQKQRTSSAGPT